MMQAPPSLHEAFEITSLYLCSRWEGALSLIMGFLLKKRPVFVNANTIQTGIGTIPPSQSESIPLSVTTTPNTTALVNDPGDLQAKYGWVSRPNQRGMIEIIWSCVVTLGICVWQCSISTPWLKRTANPQSFSVGFD